MHNPSWFENIYYKLIIPYLIREILEKLVKIFYKLGIQILELNQCEHSMLINFLGPPRIDKIQLI